MPEEILTGSGAAGTPEYGAETPACAPVQGGAETPGAIDLTYACGEGDPQTIPQTDRTNAAAPEDLRAYTREGRRANAPGLTGPAFCRAQDGPDQNPCYTPGKRAALKSAPPDGLDGEAAANARIRAGEADGDAVCYAAQNMPLPGAAANELNGKPAVAKIGEELFRAVLSGDMPQDMQVAEYMRVYPNFLSDCMRFGAKAALRTVRALQDAQFSQGAMLKSAMLNRSLPAAIRPGYNDMTSGEIDYGKMSPAEFKRAQEKIRKAFLSGKKVKL
ncbi:MAG: hypothetical protein LBS18_05540 [Clostridiales bacterium]|jgi:hypothetical protein|nr:hypothetical protein [Clostridiales bacterium]